MRLSKYLALVTVFFSTQAISGTASSGLLDANKCMGTEATVMVLDTEKGGICTGTVIREDVVMTAAHCVHNTNAPALAVSTDRDLSQPSENIQWAYKVIVHPKYVDAAKTPYPYQSEELHDIALLFLVSPLRVSPAELPDNNLWAGAAVVQEGYGRDETNKSGLLKCRTNTVQSVGASTITSDMLCMGDSGGPIYRGNTVYGIASVIFAPDGAKNICLHEGVYISTYSQRRWILEQLGEVPESGPPFGCGGIE